MKTIEKGVDREAVDYATDSVVSNLSVEGDGHPSGQGQHLLYLTKNADMTPFKTGSRLM